MTIFTLGRCDSLGYMAVILNHFILGGCGCLERIDFQPFLL